MKDTISRADILALFNDEPIVASGKLSLLQGLDQFAPDLLSPPPEWFNEIPPEADDLPVNTVWVNDEGRVYGNIHGDTELIGHPAHFRPNALTASTDKYLYQGATECSDGSIIATTDLAFTEGHGIFPDWRGSMAFNAGEINPNGSIKDDPAKIESKVARVRYFNTDKGIAVAGAVYPNVNAQKVVTMRGSAISGHWQPIDASNIPMFLGAVFVNRPGLPLAKVACGETYAMVASMEDIFIADDSTSANPAPAPAPAPAAPAPAVPPAQPIVVQPQPPTDPVPTAPSQEIVDALQERVDKLERIEAARAIQDRSLDSYDNQLDESMDPSGVTNNG